MVPPHIFFLKELWRFHLNHQQPIIFTILNFHNSTIVSTKYKCEFIQISLYSQTLKLTTVTLNA